MSLACARTARKCSGTLFIITFSVKQMLAILLWLVAHSVLPVHHQRRL